MAVCCCAILVYPSFIFNKICRFSAENLKPVKVGFDFTDYYYGISNHLIGWRFRAKSKQTKKKYSYIQIFNSIGYILAVI